MTPGVQSSSESSGTAFAFVRPLPGVSRASDSSISSIAGTTGSVVGDLAELLFPPKTVDSENAPPLTGIRLGHFILEERIGRGGMGAVFRAIDQRLNRVVALKVLTPQQSQDPAAVQRFHNEARAAAQLDHDHIARVHYVGEDRGLNFIAFEFVSGINIRDLILQRGRLSPPEAVSYALQIAEALRHTAAKNVVHRDIKPSNIIVSSVGRVKLVDLGLARQLRDEPRESEDLTVAGTALGTFDYISPEQAIDARNVDVRSDIYSLGCTLYHMLTGEPPYPRGSMFEKVMNHHRPTPPDPALKNPLVSPGLSRIVRKMMASNPDDRYAQPDALIVDLAEMGREFGLAPVPTETYVWSTLSVPVRPGFEWDGTKVWLGLVILLLLAALLLDRAPWLGVPANPDTVQPLIVQTNGGVPQAAATEVVAPPLPEQSTTVAPPAASVANPPTNVANGTSETPGASPERVPFAATGHSTESPSPVAPATVPATQPNLLELAFEKGLALINSAANTRPKPTPDSSPATVPASPNPVPPVANPVTQPPFALLKQDGSKVEFNSLFAALTAAEDNAVIELQFDGRTAGPQDPVSLKGKRGVRIRPADSYRPILEFRWKAEAGTGPLNSVVRMLSLTNAGLELYDVDLELWTTSQAVVDRWSLFSLTGRCDLVLKGCSCTLANPAQLPAALIELPTRESADLTQMMKDQMLSPSFQVRIEDSVIRGQGNLFSQWHCHPSTLSLQNVAVGLSERLVRIDGSEVVSMPALDEEQEIIDLQLDHVSVVTGAGLLEATSGSFGRLPVIQIDARDSLFSVLDPTASLVTLTGHEELDQLGERLTWMVRREPNFYELLGPMWLIDAPQSIELDPQRRLDFQQWTAHWNDTGEQLVRSGLFRNPRLGPPANLDRIEASDFVLRSGDITPNPALGATSDKRDAGVDWTLTRIPRELPQISR